jgi:hypothetical protein
MFGAVIFKFLQLIFILSLLSISNFGQKVIPERTPKPITIEWVDSIPGDFSFAKNWEYPLGVEMKQDGKAGCADGGFCPERCYAMLDSNGIVLKDSSAIFYQLLDTTHKFHSIECEAWCYEWAGTDIINVIQQSVDTVHCSTEMNIATHCSLELNLVNNFCFALIDLKSIVWGGNAVYSCNGGYIKIDKKRWQRKIMKAEFRFTFYHKENPKKLIYWKGKIYTVVK